MKRLNHASAGLSMLFIMLAAAARAQDPASRSWLGDAGHFFMGSPRILASNPEGKAFTVTAHRHVWKASGTWANGAYQVLVFGPASNQVATGTIPGDSGSTEIKVPAGDRGIYRIEFKPGGYGMHWVECSLERMVACGDFHMETILPRRWYFFVPAGTRRFTVKVPHSGTHRQDYGFFIVNPRGQRVDAIYGGKPLDMSPTAGTAAGFTRPWEPTLTTRVIDVDPGADGRFWSVWSCGGDSHNFGGAPVVLDGVPSCMASAPEQWFDPATGKPAPRLVYDESRIRWEDTPAGEAYPHYICSPSPFLGDEDYNGWRGPHTIWLLNPENRALDLNTGTYLAAPAEVLAPVKIRVTSPTGKVLHEGAVQPTVYTLPKPEAVATFGRHSLERKLPIPAAGAGVYRVDVDAVRWFPWTTPATPVVIEGRPAENGAARFALETGTVRHWYLFVPKGTKQFRVGVQVKDPLHALRIEINAPNRLVDELYVKGGARQEAVIDVPPALSGLIWFLRIEPGASTRFISGQGNPQQVNVEADIDLQGVPGYLAPTWEQWFDPRSPADGAAKPAR
jgi:hypothetical protein